LFSGIGGPELAAEWMGWENVFHCEINLFGQKILKHHESNSDLHEDIKKTDFTKYRGSIDIISGGFPCQPYSSAGKRKGKEDDRHLWPEMLRVIREVAPKWVVGENVLGLVNWNGGLVFEEVQADLEAEGYEVQPFILPAAGIGAPHQRYRVWFVAHAVNHNRRSAQSIRDEEGQHILSELAGSGVQRTSADADSNDAGRHRHGKIGQSSGKSKKIKEKRERVWSDAERTSEETSITHPTNSGLQESGQTGVWKLSEENREGVDDRLEFTGAITADSNELDGYWDNFPTQSPVCDGNDGFSTESLRQRIREDSVGHLSEKEIDKIISEAYIAWRTETIKAGGNAIVPQVIHQIFKTIQLYEDQNHDRFI